MKLSKQDSDLFFNLMWAIQFYVNQKNGIIPGINNVTEYSICSSTQKKPVRDLLFQNISVIDDFINEKPKDLTGAEIEIIRSWKNYLSGEFIVERLLNKHAVFIKDQNVYAVLGLQDSFFDVLGKKSTPVYVKTVLLPFKGQIIYDGLLEPYNISFGGGIKAALKDTYLAAKERSLIITDLLAPIQPNPKPKTQNYKKELQKLSAELAEMSKKLDQSKSNEAVSKLVFDLLSASIEFSSQMISSSKDFSNARKKFMKVKRAVNRLDNIFYY